MKNDDQMYQSVLSRREEYRQAKIKRRCTILRITPVLACACLAVVLGVGYRNHFGKLPEIPTLPDSTQASTTELSADASLSETETSVRTEPTSTSVTEPTETEPAALTETETLLPTTDATEPPPSAETTPEPPATTSPQQEQPHTELTETAQSQPPTQPPAESTTQPTTQPTVQPAAQEMTGTDTVTQDVTVTQEGTNVIFDEPPLHMLYVYARFGEEQQIYIAAGLEVGEKEIGTCIGEAEVIDGWDGSHRLTVKTYLVNACSTEECIAVYFPEEGYYLYQITNDIPDYL